MFGKKLRELRTEHGYSMDDLAQKYNEKYNGRLNKSTISRYENGLQEPMIFVVKNLADFFTVSIDCLTGEEMPPATKPDDEGLDPLEAQLMSYVRQMTPDQKEFLLAQLKTMNTRKDTLTSERH